MAAPVTFRNPVIQGFNPDPTVCVVPATETTPTTFFLSTSTFELFPGCAIYTSTNLIDWKLIGHALTRRSQIEMRTVEPGAGSWASTLRYRPDEKRWYLANGLFQRYRPTVDERIFPRGFYVWTDNIWDENAWSDPVYFDNPGFDQDLFWDDDGKVFLSTTMRIKKRAPDSKQKDFAIHISEIDLPTGRTLTPPKVIRESPHALAEGSHIIKRGDWYYLFTAEGGTEAGHQEWVLRSRDGPYGPWEGQGKPLWYNGPDEEVQRTGHADVFEDGDGQWWAVFLGVRPLKHEGSYVEPPMGRETFLVTLEWEDDWPVFNSGKNITLETEGRAESVSKLETNPHNWTADLSRETLELGWYQKNTPLKQFYSLTERPGYLRVYGNCFDLSSPESPALLLRKQSSYYQRFSTKLEFNPTVSGYEAGVVLWWSQYSYAAIGIIGIELEDGTVRRKLILREPGRPATRPIESDVFDFEESSLEVKDIEFVIVADGTSYSVSVTTGAKSQDIKVLSKDLTIAPPVGACFTGVMYGVYSFGKGEPVIDPADFKEIVIEEQTHGSEE